MTGSPLKYKMDNSTLLVSICMGIIHLKKVNSILSQGTKWFNVHAKFILIEQVLDFGWLLIILTHISLASFLWEVGK